MPEAAPFGMVLLIFPMVFYLTHASPRYRFPMDPILVVLATSTAAHFILSIQEKAKRSSLFHRFQPADSETQRIN
jgi:hypothetical protein